MPRRKTTRRPPTVEWHAETRSLLPPAIQSIVARDIPVSIERQGFMVGGFYKHGAVLLRPSTVTEYWEVVDRDGTVHVIRNFGDLVALNNSMRFNNCDPGVWAAALRSHGYEI